MSSFERKFSCSLSRISACLQSLRKVCRKRFCKSILCLLSHIFSMSCQPSLRAFSLCKYNRNRIVRWKNFTTFKNEWWIMGNNGHPYSTLYSDTRQKKLVNCCFPCIFSILMGVLLDICTAISCIKALENEFFKKLLHILWTRKFTKRSTW